MIKELAVLIPVFNEENTLEIIYKRIKDSLLTEGHKYYIKICFLNNCSTDKTLDVLKKIAKNDPSVFYITYSKNIGYQASILGGLINIDAQIYAIIDGDGEDPPEILPKFIEKYEEGYKFVYGVRMKRKESSSMILMRKLYYRIMKYVADSDFILDMAEFSLFDVLLRNAVISQKNSFPFIRSELAYVGYKRIGIEYDRERRISGMTNYNIISLLKFAIGGFLTTSTFALRLPLYVLPLFMLLGLLGFFNIIELKFIFLIILIYLCGVISVISLYLARVYKNQIQRQLFFVNHESSKL